MITLTNPVAYMVRCFFCPPHTDLVPTYNYFLKNGREPYNRFLSYFAMYNLLLNVYRENRKIKLGRKNQGSFVLLVSKCS